MADNIVVREYKNFSGVDFTNSEVQLNRSPDALNVWKNYKTLGKSIETRPDIELVKKIDNFIYGLFFYKNIELNKEYMIVHSGGTLKSYEIGTTNEYILKSSGMNPHKSQSFIFGNKIYIKDGLNYLECTGTMCNEVVGYIPTTTVYTSPSGSGEHNEDVNLLSDYRKNVYYGDGETKQYVLDAQNISDVSIKVDGVVTNSFTVDNVNGKVTFSTAPKKSESSSWNVEITFKKAIPGSAEKIKRCTILETFDNRVFFSGNQDYPNTVYHSMLNYPNYCSTDNYYSEGMDVSPVKAMVTGNNALWVFKEPSQVNTNVFYHTPTYDSVSGKIYPNAHSNISIGCVSTAINFNDDICFFSENGLEGVTGDIQSESFVGHRSSLVDGKMIGEQNYKKMVVAEWQGYLLVCIKNKVFLADSKSMWTNGNHYEYEWFYWEFEKNIINALVKDEILYLCMQNGNEYGIYKLTANNNIISYWTTPKDEFKYPEYQKTTNKRGSVIEIIGEDIEVSAKIDNEKFNLLGTFNSTKNYIVPKIKLKKFRDMQLKIGSNKNFKLNSCVVESFVGAYVKR